MKEQTRALVGPVALLLTVLALLVVMAVKFRPDPGSALLRVSGSRSVAHARIVRDTVAPVKPGIPAPRVYKLAQYIPRLHVHHMNKTTE